MNNIVATPSRPNNEELGALFGDTISDYEDGDRYEVAVTKEDGSRIAYCFHPFSDHRVVLKSVSYATEPESTKTPLVDTAVARLRKRDLLAEYIIGALLEVIDEMPIGLSDIAGNKLVNALRHWSKT